ncbi:MAG: GtrA family protein [archaeon]|nr:GtrA family protein [archaeon]
MAKKDIKASLLAGFLFAVLINILSFSFELQIPYLWTGILLVPLAAVLGIYIASLIGKRIPMFFQLVKFLVVGTLNTLMDIGMLNLLMYTSGITAGPWFSVFKGVTFIGALFHSYLWNGTWTFQTQSLFQKKEFASFALVSGIGFLLNITIASVIVNFIGPQFGISDKIWANVGALTATATVFTWNFLGYKLIVFKK